MANNLFSVTLTGRLTKDAVLKETNNGRSVLNFSVANNQKDRNGNETTIFVSCSVWGPRGAAAASWMTKGRPVTVTGEVKKLGTYPRGSEVVPFIEVEATNFEVGPELGAQNGGGAQKTNYDKKVNTSQLTPVEDDVLPF